jgi:hypothetical protein
MKKYEWRKICLILLLLAVALELGRSETVASESHVPEGLTMQVEFNPGIGEPLGIFKKAVGKVVLIHSEGTSGYWAQSDLPLYMKDKVITPEEGLALMQFLDESTISVAEDSELIINRFIFDPGKFDRSTFLSMKSGRSRFWVKKLQGYIRSEFKVKTKTMVAGVRGSDFVLIAGPKFTEAMALDDTVLEIVSLAAPDKIIVLRSFEKVRVDEGMEVSPIEKITPAEAARIKNDLPMPFDKDVMDAAGIFKTEGTVPTEEEEEKKQSTEEGGVSPAVSEKGETTPTRQPTEEVYQAEKTTEQVTVKKETVPTEEETKAVQDEIAPILDVEGKPVIIISGEDLEPVLSDDETNMLLATTDKTDQDWYSRSMPSDPGGPAEIAAVPTGSTGGSDTPLAEEKWFGWAMINNPGDKVDIAAVPTGSTGGEKSLGQLPQETVAEEIIQDAIQDAILAPLPGLPQLPVP